MVVKKTINANLEKKGKSMIATDTSEKAAIEEQQKKKNRPKLKPQKLKNVKKNIFLMIPQMSVTNLKSTKMTIIWKLESRSLL